MASQIRVLLVEDTPIAQHVLKAVLVKEGCAVDIAADGIIALDKAMNHPYDLILMDIGLGDGPDGFDVTVNIKAHSLFNKITPIYAVTAHNEPEYEEKALSVGMVGYFNKPFKQQDAATILDDFKNRLAG